MAGLLQWTGLEWSAGVEWTELTAQLGTLALIALSIERTLEVIVAVWRRHEADEIQSLVEQAPADSDERRRAEARRRKHTAGTRRIACGTGFVMGTLIALVGVRVLEQWVREASLQGMGLHSSSGSVLRIRS